MKVKGICNERGSQSESGSKWKWLYNKSECGGDYAMKGSESYYTLKVKVKGVVQWKGSESGYTQNESKSESGGGDMEVKLTVIIQWKWECKRLYNERESESDYMMRGTVIIQWKRKWKWLYNGSENDRTLRVRVISYWQWEWQCLYNESESERE